MAESIYSQQIYDKFVSEFSEGWIDSLDWSDGSKRKSLLEGVSRIKAFVPFLFSQAARLVLSGDHLINDVLKIEELEKLVNRGLQDPIPDDKHLQTKLMLAFNDMLYNLHDAIWLLKYHINLIKEKLKVHKKTLTFSAILYERSRNSRDEYVSLFEQVCDVCFLEYNFSYEEEFINELLFIKERLERKIIDKSGETKIILDACLVKVELLLSKLSVFSKNKQISYNYDFEIRTIKIADPENYPPDDFRHLFLKFLDPERLEYEQILEWQKESHNKDVAMWQLAFLMRYYTKISKSLEQINGLLKIAEKHHSEYVTGNEHNIINDCAARSFRNYMHNSRLSFLLCHDKLLTLKELKDELNKIEAIQNETFIFNYHPYQKMVEYLCDRIDELFKSNNINSDLEEYNNLLQKCFKHFKECFEWCKQNHPYLLQLRYNFSTIEDKSNHLKVFYPSSFCRPLRYGLLKEKIEQLNIRVFMLDYQVRHFDEHRDFLQAKKKIESMERKNIEHMGVFVTVTTFLVGLLSIFVGNSVASIFERIEYVIALGLILLSFICLGFFLVTDKFEKGKPWIFSVVGVVILIYLFSFLFCLKNGVTSIKNMNDDTISIKTKNLIVPTKINTINNDTITVQAVVKPN